jgi:hypothetical protein
MGWPVAGGLVVGCRLGTMSDISLTLEPESRRPFELLLRELEDCSTGNAVEDIALNWRASIMGRR